jgi:hypothetical protein
VAAISVLALWLGLGTGLSSGGSARLASKGRPVLDLIFEGQGTATYASSGPEASNVKSASIAMRWKLQWQTDPNAPKQDDYLSLTLGERDITGTSKLVYYPAYGTGCDGDVRPNTTVYGREAWRGIKGGTGLPVPLVLGFAAEPCWSAKKGGGTGFFASSDYVDRDIYARLPANIFDDPQPGRYPYEGHFNKTYPSGTGTATTKLDWSGDVYVRVNGLGPKPGKVSPPSSEPTTPEAVRRFARDQWRQYSDLYLGIVTVNGIILLREPLARPILLPVMSATYMAMTKFLTLLERAFNDPPLGGYTRIARVTPSAARLDLPACADAPAGARAFCRDVEAAALRWLGALDGTERLARALATTVGRESGAAKAGDKKALARQQRAALALLPKLRAALATKRAAGAQLAAVLRSAGVRPRLTARQTKQNTDIVLEDFAARGVSSKDITRILGVSRPPARPLDLVSLLAR